MSREANTLTGHCGSRTKKNLEVDVSGAGAGAIRQEPDANGEEGAGRRRAVYIWSVGGNPWSENPGRGSGMKQARKVHGGASRREGEKP
jgi:hypothetical protein